MTAVETPTPREPKNAKTAQGKRFYSWRGEAYWSVTTIIGGGVPKPALLPWGIKMVAEGACDLATELPALVAKDRDAAVRMLKGLPYSKRDKAADLGSYVHLAAEAHTLGKPFPPWPIEVAPYMRAFVKFLDDFQPDVQASEASVYSRTQRYAGTLDMIAGLTLPMAAGPGRYVIDTKTGKDVYPEVGLQLAAYRHAEFIGLPDGSEAAMKPTDGALALHLAPDRYRLIEVRADDTIFKAFLFAREVFRFCDETAKTVLGVEYAGEATTSSEGESHAA